MTPELFAAAAELCRAFAPAGGYGLVYGSQATGPGRSHSDLDLVLVGRHRPGSRVMSDLIGAVRRIHDDFGLRVDTEVDYETKLFASFSDVDGAVGLSCFRRVGGRLRPDPVVAEPGWLNSTAFAQRLLLNALTSEHAFLGGNVRRYRADRSRAETSLALLVVSMLGTTELTVLDAVRVLTRSPDGAWGKDFLGYTPTAYLCSAVEAGLSSLADQNVVEVVDGTRFRRRHVVAEPGGADQLSSVACDNGVTIPIERTPG
ncbi:hypothetical protein [Nocardia higoensis]|uniref:hypothetical protein n=1 Tax=Nocardia higoensis TaxID=228599 RepID=UPI00030C2DB9|nr:hypothetical protein [Nocardia higoensis]